MRPDRPQRIGRTVRESAPSWTEPARAAAEAPNVVVVLLDDLGFSDIGPFGSEIDTPNLDRLAEHGVRFSNYHSTPVCSPARAALLTGINPHRAGYANVADFDPGFPNHALELGEDVLTLAEAFRDGGYATMAVGKWHLTRSGLLHDAASRHSHPTQRGFDRYYGSMEGLNSFFHPNRLVRDNTAVVVDEYPDDYYLTDDLTDEAISMVRSVRANGDQPFFLYFCHQAMHGPLGAKPTDLAKYRGRYQQGWDRVRAARFERQLASGLFPEGTVLPEAEPRPQHDVASWDDLSTEDQALFARHMEVYAAMVDNVDQNLGRLLDALEDQGDLENTIIVFTSDNGATAEGGPQGTRSYFSQFQHARGLPSTWERDVPRDLDLIGTAQVSSHYPRGWARASNTPFRLFKASTFAGGVRVPFLLSWQRGVQAGLTQPGHRTGFQYVTDLFPTLLELAGVSARTHRHGRALETRDGISFAPVLADPSLPATRTEQYAEYGGNRGFYRDGWKVLTSHPPGTPYELAEWELYHVETDPTETVNLAEECPERLHEMAAAWEQAATRNQVFPLDDGTGVLQNLRRPSEELLSLPVTLFPDTPTLERFRSSRLIGSRSFAIEIVVRHEPGDSGVLVAHGDQGGGYQVHVRDGRLQLSYNAYGQMLRIDAGPLRGGDLLVRVDAVAREDYTWDLALSVDGRQVGHETVPMLLFLAPFSGIDVGRCRGGPVDWQIHERHRSFPYTGALDRVRYLPGEPIVGDPAVHRAMGELSAAVFD